MSKRNHVRDRWFEPPDPPSRGARLMFALFLVFLASCGRNARLVGEEIPDFVIKPISYDGVTLDASAEPARVVAVLLEAIRDDVLAPGTMERRQAIQAQCGLVAGDVMTRASKLSPEKRREGLYWLVKRWGAALSLYAPALPATVESLQKRIELRPSEIGPTGEEQVIAVVPLENPKDPKGHVFLLVTLVKVRPAGASEADGLWRIAEFNFFHGTRPSVGYFERIHKEEGA